MPSALAVCRLMMNSNLLACMSTPYGLPPGHPRLELLPPHFLSGIRGANGGGVYGTAFFCVCVWRHPPDCFHSTQTLKTRLVRTPTCLFPPYVRSSSLP